jgi:hypothetical protein
MHFPEQDRIYSGAAQEKNTLFEKEMLTDGKIYVLFIL